MSTLLNLVERGWVPDPLVRIGIRRLLRDRIRSHAHPTEDLREKDLRSFMQTLEQSPIALHVDAANEQHYEVPSAFFKEVLGRNLKYSSAFWRKDVKDLDEAEAAMLDLTCRRAGLVNGQDILELGCGWGSLTLWMAVHYPDSRITAVSNSATQRHWITARCRERGLENVEVRTTDMNDFETTATFDRVVSIEMFEHMRNYRELLHRVSRWLREDGRLFVHVFSHRTLAYPFETEGDDNWMGRHFFTGGLMPSHDLLPRFDAHLECEEDWFMDGTHYQRTAEAWLDNMDRRRERVLPLLEMTYGKDDAPLWFQRWRMFFMACAELFGFRDGQEWGVSHYRFRRREGSSS